VPLIWKGFADVAWERTPGATFFLFFLDGGGREFRRAMMPGDREGKRDMTPVR
jgi:hypothetical protein